MLRHPRFADDSPEGQVPPGDHGHALDDKGEELVVKKKDREHDITSSDSIVEMR